MKQLFLVRIVLALSIQSFGQVHLQTGAAEINIPLFSYSDNDNLNCDISLYYMDGNGLKVSEVASAVGTGWNLQCGGVITREQRGLPDDQYRNDPLIFQNPLPTNMNMTFNEYYNKYFPNGYLFSAFSPSDNISNEGAYVKMYSSLDYLNDRNPYTEDGNFPVKESIAADRELDIFHLDYGKGTVQFVIGKYGQIKVLNDDRIKIEFFTSNMRALNIKTCIDHFIVTDADGIQYYFSAKELAQSCVYNKVRFTDENNVFSLEENPLPDDNWAFIGTGQSPPPDNRIPVYIGKKTESYIVTKWFLTKIQNPLTNKAIFFNYEQFDIDILGARQIGVVKKNNNQHESTVIIRRQIIKALRLVNISCPTNEVNFIYETITRIDVPNENPLKKIQVTTENNLMIKEYLFRYGYFFKSEIKPYNYQFNPSDDWYVRLCLKSIQELGNDGQSSLPPYLFDYYLGDGSEVNMVPPSFSYWTDHWGYYNPHNGFISVVSPNVIPAYALSYICINSSTVREPVNGLAQNGIIKELTYPSGGRLTYVYEQNDAFYNGQNIKAGGVRVKKVSVYDGANHENDMIKEYKYLKVDGVSSSGWGYETPEYYILKNARVYRQAGNKIGMTFHDFATSFATKFNSAGIRSLGFTFNNESVDAFATMVLSAIIQRIIYLFAPDEPEFREESRMQYSNISFQSLNPLPYQYSRVVEISKTLSSFNGKTVYEFTSDNDKPIDIINFTFPFSNKDRYVPWAYGLPKRIAVYKSLGPDNYQILKETINEYSYIASFMSDQNYMSKKWEANKITYDAFPSVHFDFIPNSNDGNGYLNQFGDITESIYYPQTGHTELLNTKERAYNKDATGYIEVITNYTYNHLNYQPKSIITTNSAGDAIEKRIYYPEDYTYGGFIIDLKDANMVNTPIATETWITKSGGQPQMLSASVTEFSKISNGDIKPSKTNILNISAPLTESQIGAFNPSLLIRNTNLIQPKSEITYNASGNVMQTFDVIGNRVSSFIYNDDNFIIAKVKSAYHDDIAFTSFESIETGGWEIISGNIITNQGGITGEKIFSGTLSKSFSQNGNYVVSLWAEASSNVNANNTNGSIINTIGNWNLYMWHLNSVSAVTITGSNYDEVRIYPLMARMETTTYDEFGNKIAECDANNKITYYQYDGLGRLTVIKDAQRNVVKKIEYDYAMPSFFSVDKSGNYTRNNCLSGYTPGTVYVSVPAEMFSSTVSQADADNQALAYAQQQANQNATCTSPPPVSLETYNYTTSSTFSVHLINEYNVEFFFYVNPGSQYMQNVPPGTYTIEFSDVSNTGIIYGFRAPCGYYGNGNSYTFYNITISSNCHTMDIYE